MKYLRAARHGTAQRMTSCSSRASAAHAHGSACSSAVHVLIAKLSDLHQAAQRADVRLLQLIRARHDGRTTHSSNTVVVSLANAPNSADVRLQQEMLRQICSQCKMKRRKSRHAHATSVAKQASKQTNAPDTPFSVITMSGRKAMISLQIFSM
jgi:sugar diacid utilization regulator